jgi:hypothetical protein
MNCRLSDALVEINNRRKTQRAPSVTNNDEDWEEMDTKNFKYIMPSGEEEFLFPLFKERGATTLLQLFNEMITVESIRSARQKAEEDNPSVWTIHCDYHMPTTIGFFMQVLAVTIRIFGLQNIPTPSDLSVSKKQR